MTDNIRRVLAVGEAVWWGHGGLNTFSVHSPNWLRFNNVPCGETPQAIFLEATRTWIGGDFEDRLHRWRRVHVDQRFPATPVT